MDCSRIIIYFIFKPVLFQKYNRFNSIIEIDASKGCKTISGVACDIPFTYNKEYYDTCINVDNGGAAWCYTNATTKIWENCESSSCFGQAGK